jgi:hypothetical protein
MRSLSCTHTSTLRRRSMAKKKAKGALIYLVLDRSGSMAPIRDATIAGVNQFLDETRQADPDARFSLLLFDHSMKRVYSNQPLSQIEKLGRSDYQIGGNTALLDAIGTAIYDIEQMADKPEKIVVTIMTDGAENNSHEYTLPAVKALISRHETEDKWQILFLGANLDSFAEAGAIGIARSNSSVNWEPTGMGTQAAYMAVSGSVGSFLRGMSSTADVSQATYNSTLASIENNAGTALDPTVDVVSAQRTKRGASPK